jgi:hypothetical protein
MNIYLSKYNSLDSNALNFFPKRFFILKNFITINCILQFYVLHKNISLQTTRGVSDYGLVIYILKYLKAKQKLLKFKYFTTLKHNLQKILLKENQNNSITNLKFQQKPKYHPSNVLI